MNMQETLTDLGIAMLILALAAFAFARVVAAMRLFVLATWLSLGSVACERIMETGRVADGASDAMALLVLVVVMTVGSVMVLAKRPRALFARLRGPSA